MGSVALTFKTYSSNHRSVCTHEAFIVCHSIKNVCHFLTEHRWPKEEHFRYKAYTYSLYIHSLSVVPLKMYIQAICTGFVTKVFLLWSSVFCKEVFLEIAWDPCCHCHHGVRKLCYGLLQIGESCHMKPWTAASGRLQHTWSAEQIQILSSNRSLIITCTLMQSA